MIEKNKKMKDFGRNKNYKGKNFDPYYNNNRNYSPGNNTNQKYKGYIHKNHNFNNNSHNNKQNSYENKFKNQINKTEKNNNESLNFIDDIQNVKMVNNNLIKYTGYVNVVEGYILIDSGATNNFFSRDINCPK